MGKLGGFRIAICGQLLLLAGLTGCSSAEENKVPAETTETAIQESVEMETKLEALKPIKPITDHNPVMTQRFGADPYALVYGGRVYLYMTGDKVSYNPDKTIKENTYGNIDCIHVISSDDLVNWTDHGIIHAAGKQGAAKWGGNSWAPAAAYKNIDGKDKFFLYFANSGNGIAVLTADNPAGPFTDPLGEALISRETPTCAEVTWLFDPAVLMDEDGQCYIYFGGGVPAPEKADNPGTARVAKLSEDMIHLDGDPVIMDNVPYLFEDSGINRIGDTYYYSYCTNFNVTGEATEKYGFHNGEIMTLSSDKPMEGFTVATPVLRNPGDFFGRSGNNHHCMFEFEGKYYMAYHSRILEEEMDIDGGYRSTNIDLLVQDENGAPIATKGTKTGVAQLHMVNPYEEISAVTMANQAGILTKPVEAGKETDCPDQVLVPFEEGGFSEVSGVDFGTEGAGSFLAKVDGKGTGEIHVRLDSPAGEDVAVLKVEAPSDATEIKAECDKKITGEHNVFFVFSGKDYRFISWKAVS